MAPPELSRADVEARLRSLTADDQVDALHVAVFREADSSWVLGVCMQKLWSADPVVRFAAASLLTSFIHMRQYAEDDTRNLLSQASTDFPDLAVQLSEAAELLDQFHL